MQHNVRLLLSGLLLIEPALAAPWHAPRQPVVVYDGHSAVSARPYLQRIQTTIPGSTVSMPDGTDHLSLEDRLPLTTRLLTPGPAHLKTIPGLVTPLFIMGMDPASLAWFAQAADGLVEIGARGIVVQASTQADWRHLHRTARDVGIDLMLLAGDALAQGYGITTYPVVLIDPQQTGEGEHESSAH